MSYDTDFFRQISDDSRRSAEVIVPKFHELVKPKSVVDVGCGKGLFLAQFMRIGLTDVFGIDGSDADELLAIRRELYRQVDLTTDWSIDRTYDLAVCLEVAEHLPESAAAGFIQRLCALAPVVLFSAAIPMQGGNGHVNERWVDYWETRFADNGYRLSGWPRLDLWDDDRVAFYYRQNLVLAAKVEYRHSHAVQYYMDSTPPFSLYRFVHPQLLGQKLGVRFL